jgi:hypothetical protein
MVHVDSLKSAILFSSAIDRQQRALAGGCRTIDIE